ncbi:hypothetical protein PAMC26577_08555 [Caballeronia sordidicola]|uniref:Uncharacterized protein n=1 Tax=Caballeronia sordidicola TaxID=196367 RepID=A0A242N0B2_CABSO|nr:hypothetical protein PAMC26577_08555 [Caballeronia sordidicola]
MSGRATHSRAATTHCPVDDANRNAEQEFTPSQSSSCAIAFNTAGWLTS